MNWKCWCWCWCWCRFDTITFRSSTQRKMHDNLTEVQISTFWAKFEMKLDRKNEDFLFTDLRSDSTKSPPRPIFYNDKKQNKSNEDDLIGKKTHSLLQKSSVCHRKIAILQTIGARFFFVHTDIFIDCKSNRNQCECIVQSERRERKREKKSAACGCGVGKIWQSRCANKLHCNDDGNGNGAPPNTTRTKNVTPETQRINKFKS